MLATPIAVFVLSVAAAFVVVWMVVQFRRHRLGAGEHLPVLLSAEQWGDEQHETLENGEVPCGERATSSCLSTTVTATLFIDRAHDLRLSSTDVNTVLSTLRGTAEDSKKKAAVRGLESFMVKHAATLNNDQLMAISR